MCREGVQLLLTERLVDLDELTMRQTLDDAGLTAVQTFSWFRRCRPRQIRWVTANAMTGPAKKKIRANDVIVLSDK